MLEHNALLYCIFLTRTSLNYLMQVQQRELLKEGRKEVKKYEKGGMMGRRSKGNAERIM